MPVYSNMSALSQSCKGIYRISAPGYHSLWLPIQDLVLVFDLSQIFSVTSWWNNPVFHPQAKVISIWKWLNDNINFAWKTQKCKGTTTGCMPSSLFPRGWKSLFFCPSVFPFAQLHWDCSYLNTAMPPNSPPLKSITLYETITPKLFFLTAVRCHELLGHYDRGL